jgi:hypothetical protein
MKQIFLVFILLIFSCTSHRQDIIDTQQYLQEEIKVIDNLFFELSKDKLCSNRITNFPSHNQFDNDTMPCKIFVLDSLITLRQNFLGDRKVLLKDSSQVELISKLLNIDKGRYFNLDWIKNTGKFKLFPKTNQTKEYISFSRVAFNNDFTRGVFCYSNRYILNRNVEYGMSSLIFIYKVEKNWNIGKSKLIWQKSNE